MTKEELNQILTRMLQEGDKAKEEGEVPVSAALVLPNQKVIYTRNRVEENNDPFAHAEILSLQKGFQATGSRYLKDGILIVSLEPCLMCMGAILKAGIKTLMYVLPDPKLGSLSHYHVFLENKCEVVEIEDSRFQSQLDSFFLTLRTKEGK